MQGDFAAFKSSPRVDEGAILPKALPSGGGDPEGGAQLQQKLGELFPNYERYLYIKIDATLSCYIGPGVLGAGIQILED